MEDGIVLQVNGGEKEARMVVLILIVMEDGIVLLFVKRMTLMLSSLNPYCNGRWNRTGEPFSNVCLTNWS